MTEFTIEIIRILSEIPEGKVISYGKAAALAGNPKGARQVARILHSMTRKYNLPWHRVINSLGKISLEEGMGKEQQIHMLLQEGVTVNAEGEIDLEKFMWIPEKS